MHNINYRYLKGLFCFLKLHPALLTESTCCHIYADKHPMIKMIIGASNIVQSVQGDN